LKKLHSTLASNALPGVTAFGRIGTYVVEPRERTIIEEIE
jgi:hypothetical protein